MTVNHEENITKSPIVMKPLCIFVGLVLTLVQSAGSEIVVIPKGSANFYWENVHAGVVRAQNEIANSSQAFTVAWHEPIAETSPELQVEAIQQAIARRPAGIVLAPIGTPAVTEAVAQAIRRKIPVVFIDSGLPTPMPVISLLATDNYKGGVIAARKLGSLLGGKGKVILVHIPGINSTAIRAREAGFRDTMKNSYAAIVVEPSSPFPGTNADEARTAAKELVTASVSKADGLFCPSATSTTALTAAIKDAGLGGGKIKVMGFDSTPQNLEALNGGFIQGLIVQSPEGMGYQGVMTVVKYLKGEKIEPYIDTGCTLIIGANPNQKAAARP
jgi:ribose transport system substrate-binding protein